MRGLNDPEELILCYNPFAWWMGRGPSLMAI